MIADLDRLLEEAGVDALIADGTAFEVPDILWLTGFRSPDSVTVVHNRGEETIVAAAFNTIERIKKEGSVNRTYDMTALYRSLMEKGERASNNPKIVYGALLGEVLSGNIIGVPDHLPASHLIAIQSLGYKVKPVPDLLMEGRATKAPREIKLIKQAGVATISAVSRVIDMIKDADVGANGSLLVKGNPLTVRDIKHTLDHTLLDYDAESAEDAIVAVGKKGFDWHYLGQPRDELKAGVPIIMDVFPRLKREFYVADVTRTVVKGTPEKRVREMFDAVLATIGAVEDTMAEGATMNEVNLACYDNLKQKGFESSYLNPRAEEGMTHSLGHGIGLAIHERPSMYEREVMYKSGHVVAVEPGVYLRKHGGVRIENDYAVTKHKPKRLTPGLDDVMYL
jgi:Xaa-Pro aminopeptidase